MYIYRHCNGILLCGFDVSLWFYNWQVCPYVCVYKCYYFSYNVQNIVQSSLYVAISYLTV